MILWNLICKKTCFLKFKIKCPYAHSLKGCALTSSSLFASSNGFLEVLCRCLSGGFTETG